MYTTKDSGERVDFSTGSKRDTNEGKSRVDLIWVGFLFRIGDLLARGAKKYGENNWMLGQPISRSYESALRHLLAWKDGETTEDHLAAVCFNIMSIMYVVTMVKVGKLPMDLMKQGDKFFECADMPTEQLQKIVESDYKKYGRSLTDIIRKLIVQPSNVYDIWNTYGGNYAYLSYVANKLEQDDIIDVINTSGDLEFSDFLTKMILKTLLYNSNGMSYKHLRDRVEVEYILEKMPTKFNGGQFLKRLGELEKLGVIVNDFSKDGQYSL